MSFEQFYCLPGSLKVLDQLLRMCRQCNFKYILFLKRGFLCVIRQILDQGIIWVSFFLYPLLFCVQDSSYFTLGDIFCESLLQLKIDNGKTGAKISINTSTKYLRYSCASVLNPLNFGLWIWRKKEVIFISSQLFTSVSQEQCLINYDCAVLPSPAVVIKYYRCSKKSV